MQVLVELWLVEMLPLNTLQLTFKVLAAISMLATVLSLYSTEQAKSVTISWTV